MAQRVGVIGLGAMGLGMAKNVAKAGFDSFVYDLRSAPLHAAISAGAKAVKSPRELGAAVEVVLCVLRDFPQIKELDINPLRIFQENEGCRALDARMILGA